MNPQPFGKYQLRKKLATGGMAEVWYARQEGMGGFSKDLVVKRILPHLAEDPEFLRMFENEARLAARLTHPNIAQVFEFGEIDGTHFIVMELVHGEDLGRLMRKAWSAGQWIAQPISVRIVANCCGALYYAHQKTDEAGRPLKIVHRDISPQNILVSFDGSVKLVDFGIAKAADRPSLTKSGAIKGKFAYMSPEQAAGKALDQRSDIYSMGLVLYELVTGVRPLKREGELATLQAALAGAIEPPSSVAEVPQEIDQVVMRALAKAPEDRYRDARAFQMALEELLVAQRWVATSVQISELVSLLFADRLKEEARLGHPAPEGTDPASSGRKAPPPPPTEELERTLDSPSTTQSPPRASEPSWEAPPSTRTLQARALKAPSTRVVPKAPKPPAPRPEEQEWEPPTGAMGAAEEEDTLAPLSEIEIPVARAPLPLAPSVTRDEEPPRPSPPPSKPRPKMVRPGSPEPAPQGKPEAPQPRRRSGRARLRAFWAKKRNIQLLRAGGAALALVALLFVFRELISSGGELGARGIYLTVISSPRTKVLLLHPPEEHSSEPLTELGLTPLTRVKGAHIRDTVLLVNPEVGIEYQEEIKFGEPSSVRTIEKRFEPGQLQALVTPQGLTGLSFWRGDRKVGEYRPGLKLELYEGVHRLELRGEKLKAPYRFEVKIEQGSTTEAVLDLSSVL